ADAAVGVECSDGAHRLGSPPATTTYNEPYHVARKFASLDHLSGGRAGWNLVTSANAAAAQNFGRDEHLGHGERYSRAREFHQVEYISVMIKPRKAPKQSVMKAILGHVNRDYMADDASGVESQYWGQIRNPSRNSRKPHRGLHQLKRTTPANKGAKVSTQRRQLATGDYNVEAIQEVEANSPIGDVLVGVASSENPGQLIGVASSTGRRPFVELSGRRGDDVEMTWSDVNVLTWRRLVKGPTATT
ncbi:hypothetical protein OSTOST_08354, partial [Ostertagia ostertagi]